MFLYEYDEKGVMESLKQEAWEDGKAEGKAEGIAQGKADIAKAMLKDGVPFETVSKYTDIPLEKLKKL